MDGIAAGAPRQSPRVNKVVQAHVFRNCEHVIRGFDEDLYPGIDPSSVSVFTEP